MYSYTHCTIADTHAHVLTIIITMHGLMVLQIILQIIFIII